MENDNKPFETDSQEDLENILEEGQEDVVGEGATVDSLTLEELNEIAGRKDNPFKTKTEFVEHYSNLKSFTGRVNQKEEKKTAPQKSDIAVELAEVKAMIKQRDFLDENPDAKSHLDLVKSVSLGDNIPLEKAWEKVKPLVEGAEAHKKELEIGVKSKNRINPIASQEINGLAEKVISGGDEKSRQELVSKWLGLK